MNRFLTLTSLLVVLSSPNAKAIGGEGFDLGAWAGDVWGSTKDAIGFGGGDGTLDGVVGNLDGTSSMGNPENSDVQWGNAGAWDEWLAVLLDLDGNGILNGGADWNGDGNGGLDLDVCTIVEAAIGMGAGFGVEANCECKGNFDTGFEIDCKFDACNAPPSGGSDVCGTVDLAFVFGGPNGIVDMTACVDDFNTGGDTTINSNESQFKKTCFSYGIDLTAEGGDTAQTCEATYDGQQCDCDIENNLCIKADCSSFVPGAKIDTCQMLSMTGDEADLGNWIPDFDVFQPTFELRAENVPWNGLDFDNMDFENFDMGEVQWGEYYDNAVERATTWIDLIGDNPTFLDGSAEGLVSSGACTLLAQAASLSNELGVEGSCECEYDETSGLLEVSCDFADYCDDESSNSESEDESGDESEDQDAFMDLAVARNADIGGLPPLCGSANMKLTYASLAEIQADVCIQYSQFPETCYSYGIPFADVIDLTPGDNVDLSTPSAVRACSARYGGDNNTCKCSIDENSCLIVDCTDFEPLAFTENCQVVDLSGVLDNPSKVVLNFKEPGEGDVVSDGNGGEFVALQSLSSGSNSNNGMAFAAMATTIFLTVTGQLLW